MIPGDPRARPRAISRRDTLRRIAIALAAALVPGAAAGCSRSSDGRVEAPFWYCYGGNNRKTLLSLLERFHAEQDRYRLVPTFQGDYFEGLAKLRTALAARAAPALTHVIGEVVPYLAEAGVLEPLERFEGAGELDLIPALAQSGAFTGGGERPLVCAPFNRSTPIAYYDRKLFTELGLAPPRTWDELREVARAATRRAPDGTVLRWGFECPIDWWFWVALVGQAGGRIVEPDGRVSLGGEAGVRALELWRVLVHEDRTMKPPPGRDYNAWQATNTDFLQGRAAMIWTSTAFLRYLEDSAAFDVAAAPLPAQTRFSVPTGGTMFVMPRGAAPSAQAAAFAFLRWMMQPSAANEWATRTGYLPVSRKGLAELEAQGFYREHPNDRVALAQLEHAEPWPWSPELFRIQREAVQPRLEQAVLARADSREVLADALRTVGEP